MFGCSHKRTTFPITLRSPLSPGAARKATYVVCLDCGREFDYHWKAMQMDSAARTKLPAASVAKVTASSVGAEARMS
jgi:hypothetical protein